MGAPHIAVAGEWSPAFGEHPMMKTTKGGKSTAPAKPAAKPAPKTVSAKPAAGGRSQRPSR
jgi:hypothetical protein